MKGEGYLEPRVLMLLGTGEGEYGVRYEDYDKNDDCVHPVELRLLV